MTNPNCCAIGLVLPLAPIERAFGIEKIFVFDVAGCERRGLSGRCFAGYSGQRCAVHQERGREVAGGSRQAAGRSGRRSCRDGWADLERALQSRGCRRWTYRMRFRSSCASPRRMSRCWPRGQSGSRWPAATCRVRPVAPVEYVDAIDRPQPSAGPDARQRHDRRRLGV